MSDTPETDANEAIAYTSFNENCGWVASGHYVKAEFARSLERRLAEAKTKLAVYEDAKKQPLAQSESVALSWMNRSLNAEANLAEVDKECQHTTFVKTLTTNTGMVYVCETCSRHWFRAYDAAKSSEGA